jgi:hypothetical protein
MGASKFQHAVQGPDGDGYLGRPTAIHTRVQPIADHPFVASDDRLDPGAIIVPDAFCHPILPFRAISSRWQSRCVGSVSAVWLDTAVERGGTMTTASG